MEDVGELQNVNLELKVGREKILELRTENECLEEEEEYQILEIKNCQSFKHAQIFMATTCLERFPNIFLITLQVLCLNNEELENFLNFLIKKIPKNREFFLQINYVDSAEWQVYHKAKNADKFFKIQLSSDKDLFLKRFKMNKKLEMKNFFEILKFLNRSIVDVDFNQILTFLNRSSASDKLLLIKNAIKSKDEELVKLLMLFVTELSDDLLNEALKAKNVDILILILNNFTADDVNVNQVAKILNHKLSDELLVKIASQNNFKILQIFLSNYQVFYHFLNFQRWCAAIKIARDKNFLAFYSELQKLENKFYIESSLEVLGEPSCKKLRLESEKIPSQNEIEEMHTCIERNYSKTTEETDFKRIKEIVKKFPNFKYFYNSKFETALEKALLCRKFKIYAFLMSEGFLFKNEENYTLINNMLSTEEKQNLQSEILKVGRKNPDNFLFILLTKIDLAMGTPKISFNQIHEMLMKLKKREENCEVMRIASQAEVKIIFDFITKSVNLMDPNCDEHTMGAAYYTEGLLYVGRNASINQRYGTFAHEMMHFVLFLVFENGCLPYCKGDTVREAEWREVVRKVKQQYENNPRTTDNIIKWVFECYKDEENKEREKYLQSAETAVRVNDILAFYLDNKEKIIELEGLHLELFDYMREKVLADLKTPNVYQMIKLNNDFGLIQKIEASKFQVKSTEKSEILDLVTANNKNILIVTNVPQLMLSKISQEIRNLPGNKLNLKARNIFVDGKALEQKHVKEEFNKLIETTGIDRIVANSRDFSTFSNNLKPDISCILVASDDDELPSFKKHTINFQWQDLEKESQNFLLNKSIKFQGSTVKVNEILSDAENSITPEILTILCSDSEIQVNCDLKVEKVEKFISRIVQFKIKGGKEPIFEDILLENFLIKTQNEQIVVISDVAGSGKTTLLRKIHENLIPKFPQHFIIFISLLKYADELTEGVGESFTEFIAKILNFDALEKEIFMQKYSKGEVKILFDAFDEISPICKENTTKLFQLLKPNGKNQIFITTRTHLEKDLEQDLNVLAHRIKILTDEEQIKFVEEYWENEDRILVKKCAKLLVAKISRIIGWNSSLIGVPLVLKVLAEFYKNQIDKNFESKIQNLDISKIYWKLIGTSLHILGSRFPQKPEENQKKSMSPLQVHQFLAICLLFDENFANSFNLNHDEDEWPFEEIARCGLIKYENGKFHFNHQTYAEYLVALFIFNLLKTVRKLLPAHLDLIFQVVKEKKFQVVRMFLNSMLNEVEKVQELKSFNSSQEICEKIKKFETEEHFLHQSVEEELFNIFEFFALVIKKSDIELFKEMIEYEDIYGRGTYLMRFLPHAANHTKLENFLDEIFDFYSENIFDDFLLKVDGYNQTILHHFAESCKNVEVFECFWNKIKKFSNNDAEKLKKFLLMTNLYRRNALMWSIVAENEISFFFLFEQVYCKFFNIKEFAYETDKEGKNLLHYLAKKGSISMLELALEKLKKEFSPEDLQNYFKIVSKRKENVLHCAAYNDNEEAVKLLVNFIENEVNQEAKKMLFELDNLKALPLLRSDNLKDFEFFFSLYEQNFSKEQISEFFLAKGSHGDTFLHRAAEKLKSKEVIEFAWTKIESLIGDKEKVKNFLLMKDDSGKNALMKSIRSYNRWENEIPFCFLFEQVYCKFFSIKEFAYETDEDGNNLLHYLAKCRSVPIIKFALKKLKNEFSHENLRNYFKLKNKNKQNVLHYTASVDRYGYNESLEFYVNFIENELGSEEVKNMLMEQDSSNNLPLHCAVRFKIFRIFEPIFLLYEKFLNFDELKALLNNSSNSKIKALMRGKKKMFDDDDSDYDDDENTKCHAMLEKYRVAHVSADQESETESDSDSDTDSYLAHLSTDSDNEIELSSVNSSDESSP